MRRIAALLGAGMMLVAPAAFARSTYSGVPGASESRARAWALHAAFVTDAPHSIRLADASSASGSAHGATAVPLAVDQESPYRAAATDTKADDVKTPMVWTDQTGSATIEGWFSEAHAPAGSASARTGLGSMTGSGFAVASELFTWEQQEQLLGQWMELNDLVFAQLNAALGPMEPIASAAGWTLPELEGIAPIGFVDFSAAREVASSAESASSPGFASARADTTLAGVRILGGFIEAEGVSAVARSEQSGDTRTLESSARVERLRIGGVEVVIDDGGLRVGSNDVASRTVVQPAFDALLEQLRSFGIDVRVVGSRAATDLREAGVLEVSVATQQGTLLLSLAHAEASATAAAIDGSGLVLPAPVGPPAGERSFDEAPSRMVPGRTATEVASVGMQADGRGQDGPYARTLPPSAVRAARTAFLVLALGGGLGALLLPLLVNRVNIHN